MITSAKNKKRRLKRLWEGQAANVALEWGGEFAQRVYYTKRYTRQELATIALVFARLPSVGYRGCYARVWAELFIQGYEGMNEAIREHLVEHPEIQG